MTTKLDKMFVCEICGMLFLFRSDVVDHDSRVGHKSVKELTFD